MTQARSRSSKQWQVCMRRRLISGEVVVSFCVTKSWKKMIKFESIFDLVSILEYLIHYSSNNLLYDVDVVGLAKNTLFAKKFVEL